MAYPQVRVSGSREALGNAIPGGSAASSFHRSNALLCLVIYSYLSLTVESYAELCESHAEQVGLSALPIGFISCISANMIIWVFNANLDA
ncbi:hypothetical protein N7536_007336 [Penicillium majusculum]|nr:hypothetical protein N7536_007336 [Penicillium majusculum]